jgi:hypothetical protein
MGAVQVAWDERLERRVALKHVPLDEAASGTPARGQGRVVEAVPRRCHRELARFDSRKADRVASVPEAK